MLVLDISCQHLGDECKLESFCAPFGRGVGECTFLEYISVEYICWYWIYHANTWEMKNSPLDGVVQRYKSYTVRGKTLYVQNLQNKYQAMKP